MTIPSIAALSGLGITAGITALVAGWSQVRALAGRLIGILVVTMELRGHAGDAARIWVKNKAYRPPHPLFARSFLFYFALEQFIRPRARTGHVMYEELGQRGRVVWHDRVPLWVQLKASSNGSGGSEPTASGGGSTVIVRALRGTIRPDQLIFAIGEAADPVHSIDASRQESRFDVHRMSGRSQKDMNSGATPATGFAKKSYIDSEQVGARLVGWTKGDIGENTNQKNPIDRLSITAEVQEVVNRIRRWHKAKEWYLKRQIAWRLGCLFFGVPGTGKTSLAKAIAQELGIPVYSMDISTMDNTEFHEKYRSALTNAPCMVLIEDIDAVFHGRENVAAERGRGLSFDCLLNVISGVENSDGVLLIVTTNNLQYIDPALGVPQPGSISSRPGRIDCAVELPILDEEGRTKLAQRIFEGCHESWVPYAVRLGQNDTGAQFEDRCATIALNLFWSTDPKQAAPAIYEVAA